MKKVVCLILSVIMLLSVSSTAWATEISDITSEKSEVKLYAVNPSAAKTEQGFIATADLVQASSGNEKLIVKVGYATFDVRFDSTNTGGEGRWTIVLTNGDFIKGVYGEMIIKRDWFGPVNPVLDTATVSEYYSAGALYQSARGVEYFTFKNGQDFDATDNFIFQWRNFKVTGVTDNYRITNGEKQGEFGDF